MFKFSLFSKEHDHSSFYQFLQMEHSHKNTDCYFFYYSTCTKGDNCPFRHEPSALGCETMCLYWKQGKCRDEHCTFRHMELRKNRKLIPCYWETQPGGCKKPHCSFMHKNARTITNAPINPVKNFDLTSNTMNQEWSNRQESDNESVPSPVKPQSRVPYCKTYEEIRLEEIQAESAAYYSYQTEDYQTDVGGGKIKTRRTKRICLYPPVSKDKNGEKGLNFEVLTLDEIRRRKTCKSLQQKESKRIEPKGTIDEKEDRKSTAEFLKDAMKTLAELKETISVRGVKRPLEDRQEDTSKRRLVCSVVRTSSIVNNVPPVKLRRSPKRFTFLESEIEERGSMNRLMSTDQQAEIEEKTAGSCRDSPKSSSMDRLNESEPMSSSNKCRKSEVEIRLCDSSTDEDQMPLDKIDERKSVGTYTVEDSKETCDSLLIEEDYLTLDMASDDILKDIDALLKEKTSV
ncbi:Zinc finger CCCH domain-containing protein 11A [Eufriesea mexicana]|uniref:Zinc finger CCCH domain-containing protein 11A n=1 Tax=Eufriesea mexicana TaxID=516756 RepID=A0A310S7L2_9HYME|nr:Zinc finger CCCH domain-containing protein 11A [Eufriesea mexicana]